MTFNSPTEIEDLAVKICSKIGYRSNLPPDECIMIEWDGRDEPPPDVVTAFCCMVNNINLTKRLKEMNPKLAQTYENRLKESNGKLASQIAAVRRGIRKEIRT